MATNRLLGRARGQNIAWNEPVSLRWDLATTPRSIEIREARCEASFMTALGKGDLERGEFRLQADLDALTQQLRRFCDLGATELAGDLECQGNWLTEGQKLTGESQAVVRGFTWKSGTQQWREDQWVLSASGEAVRDGSKIVRLERADLRTRIGGDELTLALSEPVDQPMHREAWPLRGEISGNLGSWRDRLAPMIPQLANHDLRGGLVARWQGDIGSRDATLKLASLELTDLQGRMQGLVVQEPKVVVQSQLSWNADRNELTMPEFTLASGSLAARGHDLRIQNTSGETRISGDLAFRGDIARCARYALHSPSVSVFPTGNLEGQCRVNQAGGELKIHLSAAATPLALAGRDSPQPGQGAISSGWAPLWQEDRLTIETNAIYRHSDGGLSITDLAMQGDALGCVARGTLDTRGWVVHLDGEWNYDWDRLQPKLRPLLGTSVIVSGQQRERFKLSGPLFASQAAVVSPELTAEAGLGWNRLEAFGIALGPQRMTAQLARGTVDIAPLETTLYGGRVKIDPRIELSTLPMAFVLDQPATVEKVQVSPEMCRTWLKYVAPLLADATTAQGSISM
ncbi:MAG TPA: hypothetical protein VIY86_10830, partial [Pirellulaceae bacterium]